MTQEPLPHKLTLAERKILTISGVTEILSFDDSTVVLRTGMGTLSVQGEELKLKTLSPDGGLVEIHGTVAALLYEEPRQPGGWLRRLLG